LASDSFAILWGPSLRIKQAPRENGPSPLGQGFTVPASTIPAASARRMSLSSSTYGKWPRGCSGVGAIPKGFGSERFEVQRQICRRSFCDHLPVIAFFAPFSVPSLNTCHGRNFEVKRSDPSRSHGWAGQAGHSLVQTIDARRSAFLSVSCEMCKLKLFSRIPCVSTGALPQAFHGKKIASPGFSRHATVSRRISTGIGRDSLEDQLPSMLSWSGKLCLRKPRTYRK